MSKTYKILAEKYQLIVEDENPFKDEPRTVYGDTEGLEPGETGMPHGHGYPNMKEDYDKVVRIDYISNPDADDDSNVEDQSNYPLFVTLYDTVRNLGGHEEGGWWYNVTTKVKSLGNFLSTS